MDSSSMGSGMMTGMGLKTATAYAILRAENLERAMGFYRDKLGLEVEMLSSEGGTEMVVKGGDGSMFTVYERPGMPAPQNSTLGFVVKDFDMTMKELRDRGVMFEDYDIPEIGLKTENGVAMMGGEKTAWFEDTEGNILLISTMGMMK